MRRAGRPPLRLAGRLHALGNAPPVRVPRLAAGLPGSPGGPGGVGRVPPHPRVRRPGLQSAGQGHDDDRPRRAGRAGISEAVRVGDVHLTDDGRARGRRPRSVFRVSDAVDFTCGGFECQMPCNPIQRLPSM